MFVLKMLRTYASDMAHSMDFARVATSSCSTGELPVHTWFSILNGKGLDRVGIVDNKIVEEFQRLG